MSAPPPQGSRLRAAITERITRSPGPILRMRASGLGLPRLLGRLPAIELYYEAGDPHSHLAAQVLPALRAATRFPVRVRLVGAADPVLYPEEERQRGFALADCARIAPALGLNFPAGAQLPGIEQRELAARILVAALARDQFEACEQQVAGMLFAGDQDGLAALARSQGIASVAEARLLLEENQQRRAHLGHYLPGMWQFQGDWFWAVDRLDYLQQRLQQAGGWTGADTLLQPDPAQAHLGTPGTALPPLEFFFSFRSPYSYLAAIQLREALPQLGVELRVRPVLPMAMRGMKVPRSKRLYIARDVRREADRLGIPFGNIADPLGSGAERCLNTFRLAEGAAQQLEFCCAAGTAIWSQGVDVATDEGLRYVCRQAGIEWQRAQDSLAAGIDLAYAEENRDALFGAGYWGVPCYRLGEFSTWGRDRFWMIREMVRRTQLPAGR